MGRLLCAMALLGLVGFVQGCSCDTVTSVASSMMKSKKSKKKKSSSKRASVKKKATPAPKKAAPAPKKALAAKPKVTGTGLVAGAAVTAAGLNSKKYLCLCDVTEKGADKKLGTFEDLNKTISEENALKMVNMTCKASLMARRVEGECKACKCERKRVMLGKPKRLQLTK